MGGGEVGQCDSDCCLLRRGRNDVGEGVVMAAGPVVGGGCAHPLDQRDCVFTSDQHMSRTHASS